MITELTMVNVKGTPKRELTLGPVTLVQGPNFAGKTAIAQAIRIGLLGYDPTLGKLASATYGLASGERMEVGLALDTGATACRTWEMKRGKLVTGGDKDPLTEPMMMDIEQYFALTKQGRIDYVMGMAAEGGITNDDVMGALHQASTVQPDWTDDHAGQHAELSQRAIELLEAMDQEGATQKDVVDTLLIDWAEKAKKTKAVVAQMAGATQATEQLAEEGPTYRDQTSAIAAQQAEIGLKDKWYGEMTERAKARRKLEGAVAAAEQEARTAENSEYLDQLRAAIAGHKEDMATISAELEKLDKEPNTKLQAANTKLTNLRNVRGSMVANVCTGESSLEICRERLSNLRANLSAKCCATCGAKRANWEDPEAGFDKVPGLEKAVADAVLALDTYKKNLAEQDQKIAAHEKVVSWLVSQCNRRSTLQIDLGNLCTMVRTKEDELYKFSEAGSKFEQLKTQLAQQEPETAAELDAKAEQIKSEADEARRVLVTFQQQQNQYARQCQQKLHAQQAAEERKKQEARLTVLNDCLAEMKLVKEKAANKQWDTFLATINDFTADLLKFRVEFEDGEMGYRDGKRWVSHETMSGMEQALVYMGLGVALAAKSKIKIVVMDEMGILDAMHEWKVIERMRALVEAGTISQFVGMTSRKVDDIEGVEMIRL